jgi:hypothetical protein
MVYSYLPPVRRPLKIFAYDPMLGRLPLHRITLDVLNEPLKPGPTGSRVSVIDYDGVADCYYEPVNLDDPSVLMQGGLDPTEFDPRFHQQMVYAVTMKVIENFELALGRRFVFRGRNRLKIFPHAFSGANAFYDPRRHSLLFGYFRADSEHPGANIPGQTVFSCLSHDIIAHEMTHAMTHRLRRYFLSPSNDDVLAFHEGFADIIAIFQHFSYPAILRDAIQRTQGDLQTNTTLVELAAQFGQATGKGTSLRTAIDKPDVARIRTTFEPHDRGSILVAAVFDAFFRTYQERVQDLFRIATGGTGVLPRGDLHPDLVNRIAREATSTASATLRMCIRAFDYLPPVDITFGDYLRAMVTADFELNPNDETGLRRQMVEAFRVRGIFPSSVGSLSEESLRWPRYDAGEHRKMESLEEAIQEVNRIVIGEAAATSRNSVCDFEPMADVSPNGDESEEADDSRSDIYPSVYGWAEKNRDSLQLLDGKFEVAGIHPSFRFAQDGQLLAETVLQFAQKKKDSGDMGGVPFRGGTTVIVRADGKIQYVITKPLPSNRLPSETKDLAERRFKNQAEYVARIDATDSYHIWQDEKFQSERISKRLTLGALHLGTFG